MSKSNFFNTYTSTNGTELETQSAITRNNIESGLVFDTKRKSIWADGREYGYQGLTVADIPQLTVGSIVDQSTGTTNATGGAYTYISGINVVNDGNAYTVKYSYGTFAIPVGSSLQNMVFSTGTKIGEYLDNNATAHDIIIPIVHQTTTPTNPVAGVLYIIT